MKDEFRNQRKSKLNVHSKSGWAKRGKVKSVEKGGSMLGYEFGAHGRKTLERFWGRWSFKMEPLF